LETAALLVEQETVDALLNALVLNASHDFQADWAAVVDLDTPTPLASVGSAPPAPWLGAFVAGSKASIRPMTGDGGPDDIAWAELATADLVVVLGRRGRPFRVRERRQLAALALIANHRWAELVTRSSRLVHPTAAS
jgi:hypothetical protein